MASPMGKGMMMKGSMPLGFCKGGAKPFLALSIGFSGPATSSSSSSSGVVVVVAAEVVV